MYKIKLNLFHKSVAEKLDMVRAIGPQLTADPDAQIQAAGTAMMALNAEMRLKDTDRTQKEDDVIEATRLLNETEVVWDALMRTTVSKVTEIYPNLPAKWVGIGFELADGNTSTGVPEQVQHLSATFSGPRGEAELHWDRVANAKSYKIQIAEGDPMVEANWKFSTPDSSTKSRVTVINLTSGKAMWFRVAGFNASGQGMWCDPVNRIIP